MRRFDQHTADKRFTLTMYNGGIAYELHDNSSQLSVFVQGDDADGWSQQIDVTEDFDRTLSRIWDEYCDIAEPVTNAPIYQ